MKGKRHTTEQKIRILREADGGKSIVEASLKHNLIYSIRPVQLSGSTSRESARTTT